MWRNKGSWRELTEEASIKVKKSKTIRKLKAILHGNKDNSSKLEETLLVNLQEDKISQSLNPQYSTWWKINVKIPKKDKAIVIETKDRVLVNDIKYKILASEGIKPNKYALCYNGEKMEDNRTLVSHGIKTESTLYLKTLASYGIEEKYSTFELRPPLICITSNKKFIALQTKVCHGKMLEDCRTLVTLETKRKSSFHLDSRPIIPLLPIRLPDGKTEKFSASMLHTVLDVKAIVESLTGIPISKIVFAKTELEGCKSLAFYGLEDSPGLKISIKFVKF